MRSSDTRILVTGAGGKLGSAFVRLLVSDHEVMALGRSDLDVSCSTQLIETIEAFAPSLILNCAADTDVEGAEANVDRAYSANAMLPEILGQVARKKGAYCVHFSSTGCYGSRLTTPYTEFEQLHPTTVHHLSKKAGEVALRATGAEVLILRLGWVFGGAPHHKDFVRARLAEAAGKTQITGDPFQTGNPTFVPDVVSQTMRLVHSRITGTFNCVNTGPVNRIDYVRAILRVAGTRVDVVPQKFSRKAPVSPNESAVNKKLELLGLSSMRSWEEALTQFIQDGLI